MIDVIEKVNGFVWGVPALILVLGVGIYLSISTGFAQITMFPKAICAFVEQFKSKKTSKDGVSPYRALCTALAATVGTGNLAGVAGAIAIGGPGSVFWMWVCGILGMIIKFAEATLAVRYRVKSKTGEYLGGPMYMIINGLGKKWTGLAVLYSFFGVVASFGVGNATQINTVVCSLKSALELYEIPYRPQIFLLVGIAFATLVAALLLGGAKRIGAAAEQLVPIASVLYLLLGIGILICRGSHIPIALKSIVVGAFTPKAATGGILGSAFVALRVGASRGVFTNEAGMGTASIAHASARVKHPAEQGLMGIMEVFIDTIVICTMTALVILCSGVTIAYGQDVGISLTTQAFSVVYGQWVSILITAILCLLALATVLGWGLYGARCAQYIFGENVWKRFVYLQFITAVAGSVLQAETVWALAEILNGLMLIPNLIAIIFLSPELFKLIQGYKKGLTRRSGPEELTVNEFDVASLVVKHN